jgi:flagellar basal body-associated protein FliL
MSDEGSSKKKPLMKMLLMAVVGLALIGGIAGGGFFAYKKFFSKPAAASSEAQANTKETGKDAGKTEEEDEDASEGEKGEGGEGATGPAILVYKNNVNLENKRNAYLVVELHVIFRDAELGKLATSDKPTLENSTVRSMILEAISGKTIEEASDPEMREAVRTEIKEKLNEKFAPKPLKAGEKEDKKHKKPKHPIKEVLVVSWAVAQ